MATDLIPSKPDERAMPLDLFIEETIAALASDEEEILVERAKTMRANVGPNEHAFVYDFNQALIENPIEV